MLHDNKYIHANISGKEDVVKDVIEDYLNTIIGNSDTDKLINLLKMINFLGEVVTYVQNNLPDDIERVDGYCIEPLLKEVISDMMPEIVVIPSVEEEIVV